METWGCLKGIPLESRTERNTGVFKTPLGLRQFSGSVIQSFLGKGRCCQVIWESRQEGGPVWLLRKNVSFSLLVLSESPLLRASAKPSGTQGSGCVRASCTALLSPVLLPLGLERNRNTVVGIGNALLLRDSEGVCLSGLL